MISPLFVDIESSTFQQFAKTIKRFPEEAIYIYSFKENRLVYASGWEELLFTMNTLIQKMDKKA